MKGTSSVAIVALIVAVAENGVIGKDGKLPWNLPTDLKAFRRITMGKPVIMGRKTFEAIGRPLDGRDNIVVTRDRSYSASGVLVSGSVEEAIVLGRRLAAIGGVSEVMIVGGAQIYGDAMRHVMRMYWTIVHGKPEGDAHMQGVDPGEWAVVSSSGPVQGDKDQYSCTFLVYERRLNR